MGIFLKGALYDLFVSEQMTPALILFILNEL